MNEEEDEVVDISIIYHPFLNLFIEVVSKFFAYPGTIQILKWLTSTSSR